MDDLQRLIQDGPSPRHDLMRLVMVRYQDILAARQLARDWQEIATSLHIPGRHRALAAAFWRVKKGVAAGRLTPPGATTGRTRTPPAAAAQRPTTGGFKDVTPD